MADFEEERQKRLQRNREMLMNLAVPTLAAEMAAITNNAAADKVQGVSKKRKKEHDQLEPKTTRSQTGKGSAVTVSRTRSSRMSAARAQQRLKEQVDNDDDDSEQPSEDGDSMEEDEGSAHKARRSTPGRKKADSDNDYEFSEDDNEVASSEEESDQGDQEQADTDGDNEGVTAAQESRPSMQPKGSRRRGAASTSRDTQATGFQGNDEDWEEQQLQLALALSMQDTGQPAGNGAGTSKSNVHGQSKASISPGTKNQAAEQRPGSIAGKGARTETAAAAAAAAAGKKSAEKKGKGGRGRGKQQDMDLKLSEADVLQLFELLKSENRGCITKNSLAAASKRLGLDFGEEKAQDMVKYALDVISEDASSETGKVSAKGLSFEGFQIMVAMLTS